VQKGRGQVAQQSTNERQQFDSRRIHRGGIDPVECVRAASGVPAGTSRRLAEDISQYLQNVGVRFARNLDKI